jgi:hypothetical protein
MKNPTFPVSWIDHPKNPLILPPWPEFLIADPTFVTPVDSPDGRWHLLAHGVIRGIHHFTSDDGVSWQHAGRVTYGLRPFLVRAGPWDWRLFFERVRHPWKTEIAECRSSDMVRWSKPRTVLEPQLSWEGQLAITNGNPCVVHWKGRWRLYYSAGLAWLRDCGFPEPRYIGVAEADSLDGPWVKRNDPIISPDPTVPHRNLGAGAIKVIADPESPGVLLGFNNGIYVDNEGRSRSDIRLMASEDGVAWREVLDRPLIGPEGTGWKRALVYALDVRRYGDALWMFYNARDGWRFGRERIGLATCFHPLSRG